MAVKEPLFKRLDECFWILHTLIFAKKSEAKFVQDLMHLWRPAEFAAIVHRQQHIVSLSW